MDKTRAVEVELGALNHCDGSCQWKDGRVSVLVGVYGPMAVLARRDERSDGAIVQATVGAVSGTPSSAYREHEQALKGIIEGHALIKALHPRTAVSIVAQVLSAPSAVPSAVLTATINATCLALLDAGVSLRTLFVAAHSVISPEGHLIADPSPEQERKARASFLMVFDSSLDAILHSQAVGSFQVEEFLRAADENKKAAVLMMDLIRTNLASSIATSPAYL